MAVDTRQATLQEKLDVLDALAKALNTNCDIPDNQHEDGRVVTRERVGNVTGQTPAGDDFTMNVNVEASIARGNGKKGNGLYDDNQIVLAVQSEAEMGTRYESFDALTSNRLYSAVLHDLAKEAGLSGNRNVINQKKGEYSIAVGSDGPETSPGMRVQTELHFNKNKDDMNAVRRALTSLSKKYETQDRQAEALGKVGLKQQSGGRSQQQ